MTETPPQMAPPSQPAATPQKTSGLAVGALILGICGIVPCLGVVLGLIGIVLGIVALAKGAGGKGLAVGGIIAGLAGIVLGQALMVSILLPSLSRARDMARRAVCHTTLSNIRTGIAMYRVEYEDAFPPDLEVLITEHTMPGEFLHCPAVEQHRRCDYFYLAPSGDPADVPEDSLLACDFKGNHGGEGRNVVYASEKVKWLKERDFQAELAKPVNAAFAAALRKVEGEQQRGN